MGSEYRRNSVLTLQAKYFFIIRFENPKYNYFNIA